MPYKTCNELMQLLTCDKMIQDDKEWLPKSVLFEIINTIKENKSIYLRSSLMAYRTLTRELLDNFLYKLEFNNGCKNKLYTTQIYINGSIIEETAAEYLGSFVEYGGGGKPDHDLVHTGQGFSGPDLIVVKELRFRLDDSSILTLYPGEGIDVKGAYSLNKLNDMLADNKDGHYGHYGKYLLIYTISTNKWYIASNSDVEHANIHELIDFHPILKYPLIRLKIDEMTGTLVVTNFN